MLRLQAWNERIRESLWFWPVITGIGSIIVACALARVGSSDGAGFGRLLASPEPAEVRPLMGTLLGAIVAADEGHRPTLRRLVAECGNTAQAGLEHHVDRQAVDEIQREILNWFDHGVAPTAAYRNGL